MTSSEDCKNDKRRIHGCLGIELFALLGDLYLVDSVSDTAPYRKLAKK